MLFFYSARFHFLPLIVLLLLASLPPIQSACSKLERGFLLSVLSDVSSTPNASTIFSSWGVDKGDCCHWAGIYCGGDGGSITAVSLPAKGLMGSISPSLANLTHLTHLNLSHNRLSGALPPALLSSPTLTVLDVSFNLLNGGLQLAPSTPSNASASYSLKVLNASSNSLTGAFPSTACARYPLLTELDLSRNQFDGGIGRGFGNCSRLKVLKAGNNELTGSLPPDLFDAASLTQFALPSNQISGVLDGVRLPNLSGLTMLDLSNNELTGPIPDSVGKLVKLENLLLFSNRFTGAPPFTLTNCTKLKSLNLRFNNLVGELSAVDFSPLSDLSTLDLGNNDFTGEIPESLFKCRSLTALRLARNSLQGQIPSGVANLKALSYLSLSYNSFTNITAAFQVISGCKNLTAILLAQTFIGEAMPGDRAVELMGGIGSLSLRVLALANSNLTGQVPSWLSIFSGLEVVDLSDNLLVGLIPTWIGSMSRIFYLDLSHNRLTGGFPLEMTKLPVLLTKTAMVDLGGPLPLPLFPIHATNLPSRQYNQLDRLPRAIYLQSNNLSGAIPADIGQMKGLFQLDLSDNGFSGEIPEQLCDLINLEVLNLSNNHLSGTIPPAFSGLSFLSIFSVAYNELVGPIPMGPQFDSFPNSSFDGNPGLCGSAIHRPCGKKNFSGRITEHMMPRNTNNLKIFCGAMLGVLLGGTFAGAFILWRLASSSPSLIL